MVGSFLFTTTSVRTVKTVVLDMDLSVSGVPKTLFFGTATAMGSSQFLSALQRALSFLRAIVASSISAVINGIVSTAAAASL